MSEANVAMAAQALMASYMQQIQDLERQLEAARSLTLSLEAEAHACPNHGHHRGWWADHTEDL